MNRQLLGKIAQGCILPVLLLLVWHLASSSGWVKPEKLPPPLAVLQKWFAYISPTTAFEGGNWLAWLFSGELVQDTRRSMLRIVLGFAIGAGLALPLGLLMGTGRRIFLAVNPLVQILRPIPPIAFIPLSIIWFGIGDPPAVFLIALGAFFPVLLNTVAGVHHVDGIYLRAARNLGAGGLVMFRRVILPAAMPYILTGIRLGIGTAFIVVIVAEMVGVQGGLGFRISESREFYWTDKVIAGMVSIGLIGLLIDLGMDQLNRHLLRWHRGLEN
jgi:NitT/TauT family transport system permease protein